MLYRINDEICFSPEDGLLTHGNRTDMIKLSIPAARLLEILLVRKDEVCTREYLLTEVWDKHGLTGSDNNLYQYISMLRRSLSGLGCGNAILTVPKTGFRLNPEVDCDVITAAAASSPSDSGQTVTPVEGAGRRNFSTTFATLIRRYFIYVCGFIFCLSALFLYVTHDAPLETDPVSVQLPEGCTLTYLQDIDDDDIRKENDDILQFMKKNDLMCDKYRTVFFDNYPSENGKEYGRTLLAYCRSGANKKFTGCDNYYFYNWSGKE